MSQGAEIIANVNGSYFKLVDVPGDGDCFFHSVFKNNIVSAQFSSIQDLRCHLCNMVLILFIYYTMIIYTKNRCLLTCGLTCLWFYKEHRKYT